MYKASFSGETFLVYFETMKTMKLLPIETYPLYSIYTLCRSYGVLVWEVVTFGEFPHDKLQVNELVELASNGSLKLNRYMYTNKGCVIISLLVRPVGCPNMLADLIFKCTEIQSENRPTFTEILGFCET